MKATNSQIDKMNKLELLNLIMEINPLLCFRISPRLTTTKNYRTIAKRELNKTLTNKGV